MNFRKYILITCSIFLICPIVQGQAKYVKLKFEVDGKEVKCPLKIQMEAQGKTYVPRLEADGFKVPRGLQRATKVNVRFWNDEYNLVFESLDPSAFDTDWTLGVDNKPFDIENTATQIEDPNETNLEFVYYIKFSPRAKGAETKMVIKEYKSTTNAP